MHEGMESNWRSGCMGVMLPFISSVCEVRFSCVQNSATCDLVIGIDFNIYT